MSEFVFSLRAMAEDGNFRAMFEDEKSPIRQQIEALQRQVNDERTSGDDLLTARARLNGMKAVLRIVLDARAAEIAQDQQAATLKESGQDRSRTSFPWLPRFSRFRTFPGNLSGRLANGG